MPGDRHSYRDQTTVSATSDHPDLADWLVAQGIGSISLNPDTVVAT